LTYGALQMQTTYLLTYLLMSVMLLLLHVPYCTHLVRASTFSESI